MENLIRRCDRSSTGWNSADMDVAFQLMNGPVWDGNLASKSGRDHLVEVGAAARSTDGMNFMTERGMAAFLSDPDVARSAAMRTKAQGRSPFQPEGMRAM